MKIRTVTLGVAGLILAATTLPAHADLSTQVLSDPLTCAASYTNVINGGGKDVSTCVSTSTFTAVIAGTEATATAQAGKSKNYFCVTTADVGSYTTTTTSTWNGMGNNAGWGTGADVTVLDSTTNMVISKIKGACALG